MTYEIMPNAARHTCWDSDEWDGTLNTGEGCEGCAEAEAHPCKFCGYGHAFPTHNPWAHVEAGDPQTPIPAWKHAAWDVAWLNGPHIYAEAEASPKPSDER